jgi:hypothetical protein
MKFEIGQLIQSTNMEALEAPLTENPSNIYRIVKISENGKRVKGRLEKVLPLDKHYSLFNLYLGELFILNTSSEINYKLYKVSKPITNLKKVKNYEI